MSNEIQILIGVPGSGKSTYANNLIKSDPSYVKLSRDDFRHMLKNEWYPGEEVENLVSGLMDESIKETLKQGWNIVLDNTHCNIKTVRDTILRYGKLARIVLKVIGSELSMKEIYVQNASRDKRVPEKVIDQMYKGFKNILKEKGDLLNYIQEMATPTEALTFGKQDDSLPKAIIVDIDGTIAHMENKRGPFEWHKVDGDSPDNEVLNVIRTLSSVYKVIFVTGRDAAARKKTELWLSIYFSQPYEMLLTRGSNDYRKDNIVKMEIFNTHIKGKYYIEAVFDDRDQVVKMWREELGLKCLQVNYGDF